MSGKAMTPAERYAFAIARLVEDLDVKNAPAADRLTLANALLAAGVVALLTVCRPKEAAATVRWHANMAEMMTSEPGP